MSRLKITVEIDHGEGQEPNLFIYHVGGGKVVGRSMGPSFPKDIKLTHLLGQVLQKVKGEYEAPILPPDMGKTCLDMWQRMQERNADGQN